MTVEFLDKVPCVCFEFERVELGLWEVIIPLWILSFVQSIKRRVNNHETRHRVAIEK